MSDIAVLFTEKKRAKTRINNIVFFQRFQVLFSLYIIPSCLVEPKRLRERGDVILNGCRSSLSPKGDKAVCNLLG